MPCSCDSPLPRVPKLLRCRVFVCVSYTNHLLHSQLLLLICSQAINALNGIDFNGYTLRANSAGEKPGFGSPGGFGSPRGGDRPARNDDATCFVANLPFSADENSLREVFQGVGPVKSVRLISDRETGRPKGFSGLRFLLLLLDILRYPLDLVMWNSTQLTRLPKLLRK